MEGQQFKPIDDEVLYQWGNAQMTRQHQERFVKLFAQAQERVLEIGCGRGIILSLFKQAGVPAYGLDLSETAVQECHTKGLEAVVGDAVTHLKSVRSSSLGGIFCAHLIEHLSPQAALELIGEAFRALRPGANIVFVTPNAKDLRTTERFWLDITHVRPYPKKLMESMLNRQGFSRVVSTTDAEPSRNVLEKFVKKFLHVWFMGYIFTGDLVVIATK